MSRYTLELKVLMEDPEIRPKLDDALSRYPLYKPNTDDEYVLSLIPTREELNTKLLNHYKYREIGLPTIAAFLDELEIAMDEIMPYYNQLYKSVEIMGLIEDPFGNVDVTETIEQERNVEKSDSKTAETIASGTNSNSTTSSANDSSTIITSNETSGKEVNSDLPGNSLSIPAENLDNVSHASGVKWNKGTSDGSSTSTGESSSTANSNGSDSSTSKTDSSGTDTSKETFKQTYTKKGNQGVNTYAHDMEELRKTFLNVTKQIINDPQIKELFMMVY